MIFGQIAMRAASLAADQAPWLDQTAPPATRAEQLLKVMALDEKILMLAGHHSEDKSFGNYIGRVGTQDGSPMNHSIPELTLNDAGQGFRDEDNSKPGSSTQWPSALAVGATWDVMLAGAWGQAMGEEFKGKGSNVQLGPGMCVARVPHNGRNFEYISGEDPFLGATMVAPVVKGIQTQGVIAVGKHWVNNNQETNRTLNNAVVDERTRFEIYYPPFKGAIDAGIGSMMCSYNLINGEWSCQNNETLNTDLKQRLGFQGWTMSDWGACHNSSINEGLDQEMPAAAFFNPTDANSALGHRIANGEIANSTVDASVLRVLRQMFAIGIFDEPNTANTSANVTSSAHDDLARELAQASMVLLKNEREALPLLSTTASLAGKTLAIIGAQSWERDAANGAPVTGGGGSGSVKPAHVISPLNAILARLGLSAGDNSSCIPPKLPRSPCTWTTSTASTAPTAPTRPQASASASAGASCADKPTLPGFDLMGYDLQEPPKKVNGTMACCQLCSNFVSKDPTQPCIAYTLAEDGSCYLKWSTQGKVASTGRISSALHDGPAPAPTPATPTPQPPQPTPAPAPTPDANATRVVYNSGVDPEAAAAVATEADVSIIFAQTRSGEGRDRKDLNLDGIPYSKYPRFSSNATADFLIATVGAAAKQSGKRVIVVMVTPGAVLTPWRDSVDAILAAFLPGQEYGGAIANVLFGDVEAGGRLPLVVNGTLKETFPTEENQLNMTVEQWPGVLETHEKADGKSVGVVQTSMYSEKLLVGYRGYDARGLVPAFPFGHGLGYSAWEYSDISVSATEVRFRLRNAGSRDSAEVAQVYLSFPPSSGEPPRQLKGFQKIALAAGASSVVVLQLDDRAKSIWDIETHDWAVQHGTFTAFVGASSRDIRLNASFVN